MIEKLVAWALKAPALVFLFALGLVCAGGYSYKVLDIEAYPNPVPPLVEIIAQPDGMSAEDVERYVTVPLEIGLAGMPGLEHTRSQSLFGLADVKCYFRWGTTYESARQEVLNRLNMTQLPEGVQAQMSRSLRGEMTEMSLPIFSYPAGNCAAAAVERLTGADSAFTALGYAIRNGDLHTVRELLEGDEANHQLLKKADYAGNTAVHLAAVGSETAILRELLTRGASVHLRNRANNTPLFLAGKAGQAENVGLLKEAGAHLWETEVGGAGGANGNGKAVGTESRLGSAKLIEEPRYELGVFPFP